MKKNDLVLVRSVHAGVFVGYIVSEDLTEGIITLNHCRRIWYWSGAASLSQLATDGVTRPQQCKFPVATQNHTILGVIEVIPVTLKAKASIDSVPVWSA